MPRVLAPLAFFAAATTLVLVVHRSLTAKTEASQDGTPTVATNTTTDENGSTSTEKNGSGKKRYYRVREGEFLETIAQKFDTTVDDLLQLNPGLDPNSLRVNQRIRVK